MEGSGQPRPVLSSGRGGGTERRGRRRRRETRPGRSPARRPRLLGGRGRASLPGVGRPPGRHPLRSVSAPGVAPSRPDTRWPVKAALYPVPETGAVRSSSCEARGKSPSHCLEA